MLSAWAQEGSSLPEEPDWTDSTSTPGEAEAPAPPLYPPKPLPPAPIDPTAADLSLGLPSDTGWHLPDLSGSDSWFAMEGMRLRIGPAQIRFDLGLNFGYNDNIFSYNSPRIADYITTVSPTVEVGIGNYPRPRMLIPLDEVENYFFLRYTPSFQYFAINTTQNTVNEDLALQGRYSFSRLRLEPAFTYVKDSTPSASDLGRQEYRTYHLSLVANYALTPKTFFQLRLSGLHQDYTRLVDYTTVSVSPAMGYEVGSKLQLTLGPVAGITYVEGGGEQPFQGVRLGFTYDTLRKLTLDGSVGAQATQFRGANPAGNSDFISPTFALGATYELSMTSRLTFDFTQGVSNSGSGNGQAYVNTTATLGFEQTFFSRIELKLNGTYQALAYQGNNSHTNNYIYFTARLGYLFWQERCSVYLQYTRSQRTSEVTSLNYDSNFLGSGINVQF